MFRFLYTQDTKTKTLEEIQNSRVPMPTRCVKCRMPFYRIAYASWFDYTIYVIIFLNVSGGHARRQLFR